VPLRVVVPGEQERGYQDEETAILPGRLLRYVWHEPLQFPPGSRYKYDNSDNVTAAMMARAAAGRSYRALLRILVYRPAGIRHTSLPAGFRLPRPYLHGYSLERGQPAQDVSEALTASVAWAAGGMVSTPADMSRFIRAYLAPRFFSRQTQAAQLRFTAGSSQPPGPARTRPDWPSSGTAPGAARCTGTQGISPGYTQRGAASRDGSRSVTVTATEQLSRSMHHSVLASLRHAELLAVCTAMAARKPWRIPGTDAPPR